jgi:hypothetical protein
MACLNGPTCPDVLVVNNFGQPWRKQGNQLVGSLRNHEKNGTETLHKCMNAEWWGGLVGG